MTPELRQYLTEWYEWATGDAVDREPFRRNWGLCGNSGLLRWDIEDLLALDFGDNVYPFGGEREFYRRMSARTQHLCPKRLAWVAGKIGLPDAEADRAMIERWERERGGSDGAR